MVACVIDDEHRVAVEFLLDREVPFRPLGSLDCADDAVTRRSCEYNPWGHAALDLIVAFSHVEGRGRRCKGSRSTRRVKRQNTRAHGVVAHSEHDRNRRLTTKAQDVVDHADRRVIVKQPDTTAQDRLSIVAWVPAETETRRKDRFVDARISLMLSVVEIGTVGHIQGTTVATRRDLSLHGC